MQQLIGEHIRQLRRQRSLTQTELGGKRFSKSYVSAVEREKILPSLEALRFFAEQLNQPIDYFEQLLQQSEQAKQLSSFNTSHVPLLDEQQEMETVILLDLVLEGAELHTLPQLRNIGTFSKESLASQPPQKQARYAFLQGLVAQQQDDHTTALAALEYALALAPVKYQPAILDALGTTYYLISEYHTALSYHKRSQHLLQERAEQGTFTDLLLLVELHCANDYCALGSHHAASEHYEQARKLLRATHNMQLATQLYIGLGYSLYASFYQEVTSAHLSATLLADGEMERKMEHTYQYALGYLLQSRALYQASHDRKGERLVRLTHAMLLLDFCTHRRLIATLATNSPRSILYTDLLNEAEEQCRQVLLAENDTLASSSASIEVDANPLDQDNILYTALSYLIRVHIQRATIARLSGYDDTSTRERSLASHFCTQALALLIDNRLPWQALQNILNPPGTEISYFAQSLPHLPNLSTQVARKNYLGQMELYYAAGEVAEEQGRAANNPDYAHDWFSRANECFHAALKIGRKALPD